MPGAIESASGSASIACANGFATTGTPPATGSASGRRNCGASVRNVRAAGAGLGFGVGFGVGFGLRLRRVRRLSGSGDGRRRSGRLLDDESAAARVPARGHGLLHRLTAPASA